MAWVAHPGGRLNYEGHCDWVEGLTERRFWVVRCWDRMRWRSACMWGL